MKKKTYTKKQIAEAIEKWQKILEGMDSAEEESPQLKAGILVPDGSSASREEFAEFEEKFIKWADSKLGGSTY